MLIAALGLYSACAVMVLFTPSIIMTQNATGVSLLNLITSGQNGWIVGAILVAVCILGIILMLTKDNKKIIVSAALAIIACIFSFVYTIVNGFTIDSFSSSFMCILLPLVFFWAGVTSGMYVFISKRND